MADNSFLVALRNASGPKKEKRKRHISETEQITAETVKTVREIRKGTDRDKKVAECVSVCAPRVSCALRGRKDQWLAAQHTGTQLPSDRMRL